MAFLTNLMSYLPGSLPDTLWHQKHNADYEYGVRGNHAKPCRACSDFQTWIAGNRSKSADTPNSNATSKIDTNKTPRHDCPLDKDQLGRNTWSLVHTMAAYYPEKPTEQEQTKMRNFIHGLAQFYPCESCASDFRRDIQEDPPETHNRTALAGWWCRMHNRVNRKLNKPEFDCTLLDQRWLDGWNDGSCG